MSNFCNNKSNVHDNILVKEEHDGVRWICKICKQQNILRVGAEGRMNNREYSRIFKRDVLQPWDNLYFKVHPQSMSLL